MRAALTAFQAMDVDASDLQVSLIPAQRHELADAQAVPIGQRGSWSRPCARGAPEPALPLRSRARCWGRAIPVWARGTKECFGRGYPFSLRKAARVCFSEEAVSVAQVVEIRLKSFETLEIEERLASLEARMANR
jgi:hypothetical protein